MRFISITKSINIRLDWANITGTVLKAGTPISLTGVVANTADAVGILSQDVSKSDAVVAVVTEGTIDLGEIAASYGELDDAAISAMHGITFIDDGEPVAPSGGGGLPDYSEASDGDVLSIDNGAPAWKEPSGGGGTQVLYFYSDGPYSFNTKADFSGDTVTIANAITALLANPAAYCFVDVSEAYAPAFASVAEGIITITLSTIVGSSLMGKVVCMDPVDPYNSVATSFVIVSAS